MESVRASVSQAAGFTHPDLLLHKDISFESVNICVTNMKAEGFQISQQSLSQFSCVSTSPGLWGKAGSRCEVPVY